VIRDGQLSVNLSNPCALMDQYHVWPDWKFAHLHKEVGLHLICCQLRRPQLEEFCVCVCVCEWGVGVWGVGDKI
jgi:hypothetical protein